MHTKDLSGTPIGSDIPAKTPEQPLDNRSAVAERGYAWETLAGAEPTQHNLPASPTDLVGREDELASAWQLLQEGRLISFVGPGGVGKSRLALQLAWDSLPFFRDGVYWISLASVSAPEFVVSSVAEALGFTFYRPQDLKQQLLDYLRRKEILLVLDNLEHLLPDVGLLPEILEEAPAVNILVTSRERLNLHGEWVFLVQGLCYPQNDAEGEMEDYSAVRLFLREVQRSWYGLSFSEEDEQYVRRLCQLVEGLPLAIELAAAWVKTMSCREIVEQIEKNFDFLSSTWQDVPDRHRSLRAVCDYSWEFLTPEERQVFCRLSVFRGGFRREAAEYVAEAALPVLLSLVDKSFLRWQPSVERYELHQVMKQYAAERLSQAAEEEDETLELHCDYYATFLQRQEESLHGAELRQALEVTGKEIENVRQAWRWAMMHAKVDQIEQGIKSLYRFYEIRGWYQEGITVFAQAIKELTQSDESLDDKTICKLMSRQGMLYVYLGCYEEGRELLLNSLETLRAFDDHYEVCICLMGLSNVALNLRDQVKSKELLQEALALAQAAGLRRLEANSLLALGLYFLHEGDYTRSHSYYKRALHIYREIGELRGEGLALNNLGVLLAGHLNKFDEGKTCFEQALHISREIGDRRVEGYSLGNLGSVSLEQGNKEGTKTYFGQALQIHRETGNRKSEASMLGMLGGVFSRQRNYTRAKFYHDQALCTYREIGDRSGEAVELGNLGLVSSKFGDYLKAKSYYELALSLVKETGDRHVECGAFTGIGWVYHFLGDDKAAREYSQRALKIAKDLGTPSHQAGALVILGRALTGLGDLTGAAEAYQQAVILRRELEQHYLVMSPLAGLACISLAQGNLSQAQSLVMEILSYLETDALDDTKDPLFVYLTCYRALHANQDVRAHTILKTAHSLLQERAAKIKDEYRRSTFLENVPAHREILREFNLSSASSTSTPVVTSDSPSLIEPLTKRQTQVLKLIIAGLTNQEIADQLVISLATVKRHIWNIYGKLEVRKRAQAIRRAQELGLVEDE